MAARGRFRESAEGRIGSPERLDAMIRVVPPRRWIALVAVLALLAATVVWAVVATVPTTVAGPGYLLPEGGLRKVEAGVSGTLTALSVATGDHVVVEQVIGEIVTDAGVAVPIVAPETGEVTEVSAILLENVAAGERLALVQPVGWPLVVYAYLPTSDSGSLEVGTEVQVEFGAGIGAAHGFAKGVVTGVSPFPATPERLAFILQDTAIVEEVRALGPANEIVVTLEQSAATPSGLVWGTGEGPARVLPAGLPATVVFIKGERHPIEDVL